MVNLASPKKPSELKYSELVELVKNHLNPKPSIMAERYRFRLRRQNPDETILKYVAELKRMSRTCDFKEALMDNLRDQFVCGVSGEIIRQRLFAETSLTFNSAVSLACSLEAAEKDAAIMCSGSVAGAGGGAGPGELHRVTGPGGSYGAAGARGAARGRVAMQAQRSVHGRNASHNARGAPPASTCACNGCGATNHNDSQCRFKNYFCSFCKDQGHLRRVCPKITSQRRQFTKNNAYFMDEQSDYCDEVDYDVEEEAIHKMSLSYYKPVSLVLNINGKNITMEVDTGAACSFISKKTYDLYFSDMLLQKSRAVFRFYDGTRVHPLGMLTPLVSYNKKSKNLELYVFENGQTSLIGRQWLSELAIKIPVISYPSKCNEINVINTEHNELNIILDRYKEVFDGGLGCYTGGTATLRVRPDAVPVFCRARPVPFALRDRVDAEIDSMLEAGIIEPVDCSEWATPLVPVSKKDGGLRVCADFKVTLNPVLMVDKYPLPRIEELFSNLSSGEQFTKIDLSQAYNQIKLSDDSKKYTIINTHRGLFKYNRLVFGLSSSAGIFSRISASIVSGIPNAQSFCDDILVTGPDRESHLKTLDLVLKRLKDFGLKVKKSKCTFLADEVCYLGYIISKEGVKPDINKIKAISLMPCPTNVTELRSFLGMVNFYAKFIPSISDVLNPLYCLLRKGRRWEWNNECTNSFNKVKSLLLSNRVLAHYDPERPLTLTCDASATGVGGVLTQPDGRGGERPVACVSRKLNAAERNYSQIHKEALAIVFSTNKFHQYLYGRRFTLKTDHKPLVSIFGPQMGVPSMTSSRMQRWALILTGYNFDIEYVNTNSNCADALSRLPIGEQKEFEPPEQSYLHFASDALLLDNNEIKLMTSRDPLLGRVVNYIKNGWPESIDIKELQPYYNRRRELYLELDCVMWGHRVVIPESCRQKVIKELHEPHMGIVKTKAMARSYVWWPGLDEAIEACCQSCSTCAAVAAAPPASAPIPWHWPARPYERVHIDFLGPIGGQTYLIAIDARTKWIEVYKMNRTSADMVISKLRESWSRWGIPKQLVSDNGPPFSSKEFNFFLKANGVNHMYSAPYHPSSNGAAEGAVKLIKNVIKKANLSRVDIDVEIYKFLLHYHNTPHSTTGESPARMLQGRDLRIRLDLLKPDKTGAVLDKQAKSVERDKRPCRELSAGEQVSYRDYRSIKKWSEGTVSEKVGKSDYRVAAEDGTVHHRHVDQIKRRLRNSCVFPSDVNTQNRPEMAPQVVSGQNTSEQIENKIGDAQSDILDKQGGSGIVGSPCKTPPFMSPQPNPETNNEQSHISSLPSPPDPSAVTTRRNRKPPIRFGLDID